MSSGHFLNSDASCAVRSHGRNGRTILFHVSRLLCKVKVRNSNVFVAGSIHQGHTSVFYDSVIFHEEAVCFYMSFSVLLCMGR